MVGSLLGEALWHWLLPQCLSRSSAGETEAQAALAAGMVVKPEPGTHSHCKLNNLSCFFSLQIVFFNQHVRKPLLFCKPRVFRKRREGEVVQAQKTCTCLLKLSLTSGLGDCASRCCLPLSARKAGAEVSLGLGWRHGGPPLP